MIAALIAAGAVNDQCLLDAFRDVLEGEKKGGERRGKKRKKESNNRCPGFQAHVLHRLFVWPSERKKKKKGGKREKGGGGTQGRREHPVGCSSRVMSNFALQSEERKKRKK